MRYWALLGPGVELRRTAYDLDETERATARAVILVRRDGRDPAPAADAGEVIAHAEWLAFSG